ncbi:hypothetical protein OHA79_51585 (plasmid) [Streptomyces sp. NBC_00841]|uniref:hypothetical protein n=1 Tax=Streptomyces sp. NBC_00841 TaxID=2975847 RepID=UPI002DD8CEBE|nr:hypothetical protein [Streptomyces sp. NBC_00841]WSA05839.1 hypothetical protein OHA79_51585 [Streptomyces sp. NBC_00841]
MTDYDTSTHTASELVHLVTGHLDVVFTERESDYRGVYHLAQGAYRRIEIQPNSIPGDDSQDDLYTPEHPEVQVLLLTNTPAPEPTLHTRLGAIQGLAHLSRKSR